MRKLLALVLTAAALWGGYWFVASRGLEGALSALAEARRAEGWTIDYSSMNVRGFPNRLDTVLKDVTLAPPDGRFAWQASEFQTLALSYRPNHVIAVWPDSQVIETPAGRITLESEDMRASAVVRASTAAPLDRANMVIEKPRFVLGNPTGAAAAESLLLAIREVPAQTNVYEIGAEATAIDLSQMPEVTAYGLPVTAEQVRLDAALTLDRPLDRFALEGPPPALRAIDLRSFQAEWGGARLQAEGGLEISDSGLPEGEIELRVTDWQTLLRLATDSGALTDEQAAQARLALTLLAGGRGEGAALEVPLVLAGGLVRLGPVPLGPAPRLTLR